MYSTETQLKRARVELQQRRSMNQKRFADARARIQKERKEEEEERRIAEEKDGGEGNHRSRAKHCIFM